MIRFYATSVRMIQIDNQFITKQKFQLVSFDDLKYLAGKNFQDI